MYFTHFQNGFLATIGNGLPALYLWWFWCSAAPCQNLAWVRNYVISVKCQGRFCRFWVIGVCILICRFCQFPKLTKNPFWFRITPLCPRMQQSPAPPTDGQKRENGWFTPPLTICRGCGGHQKSATRWPTQKPKFFLQILKALDSCCTCCRFPITI